ncbi:MULTISPECIES: VOC family protein [Arsenicicoccus]|uniref:VOC family protein n=1 Tax=Arsenicicoccus TaxID=267408 RepID=UPI00257AC0A5|nr:MULTISPECIES: VOC family protein [Arsenicicoccus]
MTLELFSLVVDDYDEAIAFFTGTLGFDLVGGSSCHHHRRSLEALGRRASPRRRGRSGAGSRRRT